jgi:hypothetical protein
MPRQATAEDKAMEDIRRLRSVVLGGLLVGAVVSSTLAFLLGSSARDGLLNLGTELVGAVVTYALFELIIERRERREAEKEAVEAEKAELIAQMGSHVGDVAMAAAEELHRRGWLTDGSLCNASLGGARLRRAWLANARLCNGTLVKADLREARLYDSDLSEAWLCEARLDEALLGRADLRKAHLDGAEVLADQLAQAESLAGATLPDGTKLSEENWEAEFEEWREKHEEG